MGDYELFKSKIFQMTKIDLSCYKERQMKRRIDALITKRGIKSYDAYVNALRTDVELMEEFVTYLTINVSEFYRNPEQWKVLENEIFPYLFERFGNTLKIWSAACSTGDEPYTLVMLLAKFIPLSRIKIIATDLDKQVLEKAASAQKLNGSRFRMKGRAHRLHRWRRRFSRRFLALVFPERHL